ncbi:ribonucleases P/MRP protein subunit POP1-like [Babylonia areolata]|uniref:ribonucleases P/MRP protein subunit POP1-like n=1 Tax=Babylonia areolata TaxID=304850 RepID=UPI003FD35F3E
MASSNGKRQRNADKHEENPRTPKQRCLRQNEQASLSQSLSEADSVPLEVSVAKFAESRARELEALAKAVEHVGGNKLSFQRLPKHMRRRAMSHNIRRIPQRLRQKAQAELEKREKKGANKRPSRRYRRRPSNLLSEYQRRQRQHMWLETHIWHAKRFKMTTAWGYRLPVHPSDKSLRACYRATTYHCLLQDVSYECCIQVKGPEQVILDMLSHLTSKDTGLTFGARVTITGRRWGQVMMYTYDTYPRGAVAPITFLWQSGGQQCTAVGRTHSADPCTGEENHQVRLLWMWCHPASYAQVWTQLTNACARQVAASAGMVDEKDVTVTQPCDLKAASHSPQGGTKVHFGQLQLCSLKDQLIKLRLTGPASNLILSETLKPANIYSEKKRSGTSSGDSSGESRSGSGESRWWQKYYAAERKGEEFGAQTSAWERVAKCQSPGEVPPRAVVALTVRDTRLLLPSVRTKAALDQADSAAEVMTWDHLPAETAVSPLMDEAVREEVTRTKMTEQDINRRRSKVLVPGSVLQLGEEESRLPVLLLQRPGSQSLSSGDRNTARCGVGSGWDVVAPKGWGMALWVAMVYRGARVGGLREARSLSVRSCQLHFPHDFPDTAAGRQVGQDNRGLAIDRYVRRPPAKRVNYGRLGVATPFLGPWAQLVGEWQKRAGETLSLAGVTFAQVDTDASGNGAHGHSQRLSAEQTRRETPSAGEAGEPSSSGGGDSASMCARYPDPYILRCRQLLRALQQVMKCADHRRSRGKGQETSSTRLSAVLSAPLHNTLVREHLGSLVPVAVNGLSRGVPVECAAICLPTVSDLDQLAGDSTFMGPVEPLHPHSKVNAVKAVKKKRKLTPTSLVSPGEQGVSVTGGQTPHLMKASSGNKVSLNHRQLEEKKELMKEPSTVVNTASRLIVGFLTNGDFDLGQGHGAGVGLCSLVGLLAVMKDSRVNKPLLVLVRNPTSRQYRFATLSVLS